MVTHLLTNLEDLAKADFEIVERKGRGHPDTLADRLAELLSKTYSEISREKFGTILRHQFDKLSIMGGKCDVRFGGGGFVSPIRLLINGRATPEVGSEKMFYQDQLINAASNFLEKELSNFDFLTNCRVMLEITANTTRGLTTSGARPARSSAYSRFRPEKLTDLPEYTRPVSNDTAVGCGWAPYTPLEKMVLDIEGTLNSNETKKLYPWLGNDIKVMAIRTKSSVALTICVPQVSTFVANLNEYKQNIDTIRRIISNTTNSYREMFSVSIFLNTADGAGDRDDLLYMLYTGSCAESGDEGQVSRGNRLGGVISSRRPFSMEGLSGKNPQYHGGKLYSVIAWDLAEKIWTNYQVPCEVFVVSQSDVPLDQPWSVIVNSVVPLEREGVQHLIDEAFGKISSYTDEILTGKYSLS